MNLNKVFIIGRLTSDPQLRTTQTGQSVTAFGVATNRVWTNKNGERQEDTQFHNVVVWARQAEIICQFLKKGSLVFIEGRLQTRSWQDNQGQNRKTTEIVCERVQLGPRPFNSGFSGDSSRNSSPSDNFNQEQTSKENQEPVQEPSELPAINIDEDEIKPEDVPF